MGKDSILFFRGKYWGIFLILFLLLLFYFLKVQFSESNGLNVENVQHYLCRNLVSTHHQKGSKERKNELQLN
jgi:hypothetical protein